MRDKPLILLVDDDRDLLEIMSTKLRAAGFDTITVNKGKEEALKRIEETLPDLVLMDIKMPGITGADLALALKENEKTKDVKIAFLTSMADPWPGFAGTDAAQGKSVAEEMGIQDFLQKTDDLDANVEKIRAILTGSPVQKVSAPPPPPPSAPSSSPSAPAPSS